jgi:translocator protein
VNFKDLLAKPLVATSALTAACAVSGSIATEPKSAWYESLKKPAWQPPGALFPVVWTALYTDIAVTSASVIEDLQAGPTPHHARSYQRALVVNLALNQGWSWVFFKAHKLPAATAVAGLLAASSIDLSRRAARAGKSKGLALVPYAAWCTFAAVLTAAVMRRNPDGGDDS